jgi:hypothetical protein
VVATAIESLDRIIDVSTMLLQMLDASDIDVDASTPSKTQKNSENKTNVSTLLALMAKREQQIHQLFENFNHDELQLHLSKLQTMLTLDSQLVEKVNHAQKSAKSKILQLKKNKKAINIYQKH